MAPKSSMGCPLQSKPHQPESSTRMPVAPPSPNYTPASPLPGLSVATDLVTEEQLEEYWSRQVGPVPPDKGPWYRLEGGYIQFRFGAPWAEIDRRERKDTLWRQEVLARGDRVVEQPLHGEIVLSMIEYSDSPPASTRASPIPAPPAPASPVLPPPAPENDGDYPMEWSDSSSESEEEEEEVNENPVLPDWSETSTITEERTQVPLNCRRYIRGPKGNLNRYR